MTLGNIGKNEAVPPPPNYVCNIVGGGYKYKYFCNIGSMVKGLIHTFIEQAFYIYYSSCL